METISNILVKAEDIYDVPAGIFIFLVEVLL